MAHWRLAITSQILGLCLFVGNASAELPQLVSHNGVEQLHVEGAPFLILGGELGNSSASNRQQLQPHWETFQTLGINTILAPINWEMIEPSEGNFDFSSLDWLIEDAREHDIKLVILWFGSWKNSMSSYVPAWVKRDWKRFPRVQTADGNATEILSAFSDTNVNTDANAYAAMMKHLKMVDAEQNTVIMVQVENEIGMLPDAREHGPIAEKTWAGNVPQQLIEHLIANEDALTPEVRKIWTTHGKKTAGSWADVFGKTPAAEEIFTAWHYAIYADKVAKAGKSEYNLPMYVNAALDRPNVLPGKYPSGGPLPHLLDIWKAGAPNIDFLAPDIYYPNYVERVSEYVRPGNALFIPEANRAGRIESGPDLLYSIGELDAIGYSPFAIDSIEDSENEPLGQAYKMLSDLAPHILELQGTDHLRAFRPTSNYEGELDLSDRTAIFGDYEFTISFGSPWRDKSEQSPSAYGVMIIQTDDEEFYIAGRGVTVKFKSLNTDGSIAGIESAIDGEFIEGEWKAGRWFNGDQTHQGRHILLDTEKYSIQKVKLYTYQ